jgi:hypothetical protein
MVRARLKSRRSTATVCSVGPQAFRVCSAGQWRKAKYDDRVARVVLAWSRTLAGSTPWHRRVNEWSGRYSSALAGRCLPHKLDKLGQEVSSGAVASGHGKPSASACERLPPRTCA